MAKRRRRRTSSGWPRSWKALVSDVANQAVIRARMAETADAIAKKSRQRASRITNQVSHQAAIRSRMAELAEALAVLRRVEAAAAKDLKDLLATEEGRRAVLQSYGHLGGRQAAKNMTAAERHARAVKAAKTRWARPKKA